MVMYEIWSLGHKPFEEWDVQEVKNKLYIAHSISDSVTGVTNQSLNQSAAAMAKKLHVVVYYNIY